MDQHGYNFTGCCGRFRLNKLKKHKLRNKNAKILDEGLKIKNS